MLRDDTPEVVIISAGGLTGLAALFVAAPAIDNGGFAAVTLVAGCEEAATWGTTAADTGTTLALVAWLKGVRTSRPTARPPRRDSGLLDCGGFGGRPADGGGGWVELLTFDLLGIVPDPPPGGRLVAATADEPIRARSEGVSTLSVILRRLTGRSSFASAAGSV